MSTPTPDPFDVVALLDRLRCDRLFGFPDVCDTLRAAADEITALTLPAGDWRVSVADDGTRTVTPLVPGCICNVRSEDGASFDLEWADAPDSPSGEVVRAERVENGDPTDEG